ncbi:MAG TPA: HD domain-containing phosphohydrolase [Actinomycetota bacterium]|nr:HD domain-containing phosphohydrolase [Actinomycetota bacterium]
MNEPSPMPVQEQVDQDPELPTLQAQLVVFAREVGQLYAAERTRSRELQQALDEIRDTYVATMTSFAQVVEAKDRTTAGHLDRTQRLGMAIAGAVDPALASLPETGYGFFLHDIGKVGIPEHILCKPAALDQNEWAIMREHPTIGAHIVEPIRFLAGAVDIVRSHHERWDGTGYPMGLRREQIPLAARVFAIADSFDAMTNDRPYRAAMPTDAAIDEIVAGAGTQFDPDVVEVFLDLVERDPVVLGSAPATVERAS